MPLTCEICVHYMIKRFQSHQEKKYFDSFILHRQNTIQSIRFGLFLDGRVDSTITSVCGEETDQ